MRKLLALAVMVFASSAFAGGAMYNVTVTNVRVQPLDDKGEPAGAPKVAAFTQSGTVGCFIDRAPGTKPLEVWFKGTTDANGKLRKLGSGPYSQGLPEVGGATKSAAVCAFSAFTNGDLKLTATHNFRVLVTAAFKRS